MGCGKNCYSYKYTIEIVVGQSYKLNQQISYQFLFAVSEPYQSFHSFCVINIEDVHDNIFSKMEKLLNVRIIFSTSL